MSTFAQLGRGSRGGKHMSDDFNETKGWTSEAPPAVNLRKSDSGDAAGIPTARVSLHKQTEPVVEYYRKTPLLKEFSAVGEVNAITQAIISALGREAA